MIHAKVANYISKRRREKARKQEHKIKYNRIIQEVKTAVYEGKNNVIVPSWIVADEDVFNEALQYLQKRGYSVNPRGLLDDHEYVISWEDNAL